MSDKKQLARVSATEAVGNLLEGTIAAITAFSASPELAVIVGVSQIAKNKSNFIRVKELGEDIKRMLTVGQLTSAQMETAEALDSLNDLLSIIEKDNIDSQKYEALKKLFKLSLKGIPNNQNRYIREMMTLCNQLESAQLIILANIHRIIKNDGPFISPTGIKVHDQVLDDISTHSGIDRDLVLYHWDKMVELKFLTHRFYEIASITFENKKFKLPTLTKKLCELLASDETQIS